MSYVKEAFDRVKIRDPDQPEFHQAVWEVLETLEPVFDKHPEYHSKNFEDIPAKVGFASNITIHDTLLAGTAGLESALTGCKSLYFDYHNSKKSLFLKNNLKIVFNDWKVLWDHIEKDIKIGDPSLGNWDEVIDQFDKYRDGNTNLRMIDFFEKN